MQKDAHSVAATMGIVRYFKPQGHGTLECHQQHPREPIQPAREHPHMYKTIRSRNPLPYPRTGLRGEFL